MRPWTVRALALPAVSLGVVLCMARLSWPAGDEAGGDVIGMAASPVSSSQIDISWACHSPNERMFRVERAGQDGRFMEVVTIAAGDVGVMSHRDTHLRSNTEYGYRIVALDGDGQELSMEQAAVTTMVS